MGPTNLYNAAFNCTEPFGYSCKRPKCLHQPLNASSFYCGGYPGFFEQPAGVFALLVLTPLPLLASVRHDFRLKEAGNLLDH